MEVEVLHRSGNLAVIQFASRNFPGIFAQGDTMSTIRDLLKPLEAQDLVGVDELTADRILEARDRLNELMAYYEEVLAARGISKPYL
ncbi:DUF6959 family protein [Catellatospora paridis]|uniref:DUF6959 family protein n=1 Tax=Catellatospora paridis TaxID=1617086 RepID=UPI0012D39D7B|nr:hypothetical protein [Catellatospora paridis]